MSVVDKDPVVTPYGSVADLPSYIELSEGLKALTLLSFFSPSMRKKISEMKTELQKLTDLVDLFCNCLGPRNWVMNDSMNVDKITDILVSASDPEEAETLLIEMYQVEDHLESWITRLTHHEGFQRRMHLILQAKDNYLARRYADTARGLIEVMDGFVNDLDPGHQQGMHAKNPDEMVAWDSIGGHQLGLSNAMKTFTKKFDKTTDDEVFELFRHGIVHGRCLHYDNDIVATKAWNMLFAISDWADARNKKPPITEDQPGFIESIKDIGKTLIDHSNNKRKFEEFMEGWHPVKMDAENDNFFTNPIILRAIHFLDAWRAQKFGPMAQSIMLNMRTETEKKRAGEFREMFTQFPLESYNITSFDYSTPAMAAVFFTCSINGEVRRGRLGMILEGKDGKGFSIADNDAEWNFVTYGPWAILEESEVA